jgi:teichuronic acid biosynthesis glycosyltransferase TuaC
MKVLVYTTLFPNHLQPNFAVFIKQRMIHFARLKDCEIKVVAPVPYCPPWSILGKWYQYSQIRKFEEIDGIDVFHPRYPLIPKISMAVHGFSLFFSTVKLVKHMYKFFPFDLIDSHYIYPDGLASVLLAKAVRKPVVLSARGSDINQFTLFRLIRPMIKYALDQADHVIAVSGALKEEIEKLRIKHDRISVVPNGVDIKKFYPTERGDARLKLSLLSDKKVIISVGSLIPLKGFDIVLEALNMLRQRNPNVHLYIIGTGLSRSSLERQIEELNLKEYVSLVGGVPNSELGLWYNAADVSCLASSKEGWANVIMESLACGTPVVATGVGGTVEILTSPDIGILVDRSPESLCDGLQRALETEWDRNQIRAHVGSHSWFEVAYQVREIFEAVLDKRSETRSLEKAGWR